MKNKNNTLYILDAYSWFYRFYHASKSNFQRNQKGTATNAIQSFKKMLDELIEIHDINYIIVAIDSDSKKFRSHIYPDYKAGRPEIDIELKEQMAMLPEFLSYYGISYAEADGFEADDIIGSLCEQFSDVEKIILSNDGDMTQLLDDKTNILKAIKWIQHTEMVNYGQFMAEKGYYPNQVVDFKSLAGDAGDNIKGVPGIGPVQAKKLLKEYGDVESIYANVANLPEKQQKLLLEGQDSFRLSLQLAKIYDGLRFDIELDDLKIEHNTADFNQYFNELIK